MPVGRKCSDDASELHYDADEFHFCLAKLFLHFCSTMLEQTRNHQSFQNQMAIVEFSLKLEL